VNGYLLDTNVISELRKHDRCSQHVRSWFEAAAPAEIYLSVLVVGELRRGVSLIARRDPVSAEHLETWLHGLRAEYADRILPITQEIAVLWGRLGLAEPLPPIDGLLAATALHHGLVLVTRNTADVVRCAVQLLNPFEPGSA